MGIEHLTGGGDPPQPRYDYDGVTWVFQEVEGRRGARSFKVRGEVAGWATREQARDALGRMNEREWGHPWRYPAVIYRYVVKSHEARRGPISDEEGANRGY